MEQSILDSIKKVLGVSPDDTSFDQDLILHINSVFFTLNMLGVGPSGGYRIDSKENKWVEFTGTEVNFEGVKTYVGLRVRMIFDPPATSFTQQAFVKEAERLEFYLQVKADPKVTYLPEGVQA